MRIIRCIKFLQALALLLMPSIMLLPLSGCGKKTAPTLKEFEKPATPALVKAIHREDKIILQWNYPSEKGKTVADFIILRSSGDEFKKLASAEKSKRSYEDADIKAGGNYRYKIIAQSFRGVLSDESNIMDISPLSPPAPPSNLSYAIKGDSLIISWQTTEKGIFYNVYRSLEKGVYGLTPVNSAPSSEGPFTDSFNINKTVYYTVRSLHATKIWDEGTPSEELEVNPSVLVPSIMKNVKYLAVADKVFLYWDLQESWVNRFRIYRKTEGQDYQMIGETQTPSFVDSEPPLTKRDYRLHAVGPAIEGPGIEIRDVIYKAPPQQTH